MAKSKTPKSPARLSQGEEAFALHCRAENLNPVREYIFHPTRKWRFDFFFPEYKLAIEVEGGIGGRHQRMAGFEEDCRKYSSATLLGIHVMRFTTKMVTSGEAIETVLTFLDAVRFMGLKSIGDER